ncbi:MAG: hypothetical protein WC544_02915 [Patescibacteria group bacterium]
MFRRMIPLLVVATIAALFMVSCNKEEIAALNTAVDSLKTENTTLASDTASLHAVVQNSISAAADQMKRADSIAALLNVANGKIAGLRKQTAKLSDQNAALQILADSLPCVEQLYAECASELTATKGELADSRTVNVSLTGELEARASLLDSVRQCYDVQKHNAHRSWWERTWGADNWGLPFAEPEFIATPVITSNPAVKPQPPEKKSRRRR